MVVNSSNMGLDLLFHVREMVVQMSIVLVVISKGLDCKGSSKSVVVHCMDVEAAAARSL
jgi:hypothetical protein